MTLREAIGDWLTGGRWQRVLDLYRQHWQARLDDKDAQIKLLRVELARVRSERIPAYSPQIPARPAVQLPPAMVPGPEDWQGELNRMLNEEENDGTRGDGRKEIHESTPDDGA